MLWSYKGDPETAVDCNYKSGQADRTLPKKRFWNINLKAMVLICALPR